LLYLPIGLLVNRSDRFYLIFMGRIALGEIHIIGKRRMLRKGERRELAGLTLKEMNGFEFYGDDDEVQTLSRACLWTVGSCFIFTQKKIISSFSRIQKGG